MEWVLLFLLGLAAAAAAEAEQQAQIVRAQWGLLGVMAILLIIFAFALDRKQTRN